MTGLQIAYICHKIQQTKLYVVMPTCRKVCHFILLTENYLLKLYAAHLSTNYLVVLELKFGHKCLEGLHLM